MRYQARTAEMPIVNAEAMVEWLNECTCKVKHQPLEEILADIEKERETGVYMAGEVVRFGSKRSADQFKALFC